MAENTINTASRVAALVYERATGITVANGYETDLGTAVFQGKVKVADEQVLETKFCLSVIEGIDTIEARPGRVPNVKVEQRYGLVAYGVCDPNAPNETAHKMIRDIKRAIWRGNGTFDDQVILVRYLGRDIGPRADGVNIVMALVEFGVQYVEDLTKP